MNKVFVIMVVIIIVLVVYVFEIVQFLLVSIEYMEVFYVDNQSVIFVIQDGFGLFIMKVSLYVDNFEFKIEFLEGIIYFVCYGFEQFKGEIMFKVKVYKGDVFQEVYVYFQFLEDFIKKVIYEGVILEIKIIGDKFLFWYSEDVIYIKYCKEEKS